MDPISGAVRAFLDLKHNATYTVPFTIVICTFGVTLTIVSLPKQYLHYFSKTKGQKTSGLTGYVVEVDVICKIFQLLSTDNHVVSISQSMLADLKTFFTSIALR